MAPGATALIRMARPPDYAAYKARLARTLALYVVGRRRASERPAVALVPTARGGLAVAAWTWR